MQFLTLWNIERYARGLCQTPQVPTMYSSLFSIEYHNVIRSVLKRDEVSAVLHALCSMHCVPRAALHALCLRRLCMLWVLCDVYRALSSKRRGLHAVIYSPCTAPKAQNLELILGITLIHNHKIGPDENYQYSSDSPRCGGTKPKYWTEWIQRYWKDWICR